MPQYPQLYKLRRWSSRGNDYYSLGVPRQIGEQYEQGERFIVEQLKDGSIRFEPFRKGRKGDFAKAK